MRNTRIFGYEDTPRDVLASGNDYASGTILPRHVHKRGQCLYAITGVLTVTTTEGTWVVPSRRALWIPPGVEHAVHMGGPTSTRSAYLQPAVAGNAGLPEHCSVISVSPLLHALLSEAVDLPTEYELGGRHDRLMCLLVDEIARMPTLPLSTPLPQEPRLARLCRALIQSPSLEIDIDTMAHKADMSRRSFTRLFREQTGMSFSSWRQQACLLAAVARLGRGQSVTQVAIELGYSSTSAFTAAFRRTLGAAPSHYLLPRDAS
ncbi:AraC family transcriptional regulator [Dyella mobilis]|uniref:Helix-turn-helix transcriptional regulator n=1 Tax=Dyella mobilis TaxID=1849582 RepID=A0ABS2KKC0_9GAMM|nr:helix-turn-helix transcriptional regulator [Dyella mobilis]MBM7131617.1 helix-turn-helix transcriptional regulator [Dyella mobilis]GLQ96407.1 transcriptional regulator [Dyella mobilis]